MLPWVIFDPAIDSTIILLSTARRLCAPVKIERFFEPQRIGMIGRDAAAL